MNRKHLSGITGLATALIVFAFLLLTAAYASIAASVSSLQQATNLEGYRIYFTTQNGESSRFDRSPNGLSNMAGILQSLGATLHTLNWNTIFPSDADLVIIAGPSSNFSNEQIVRLWSYVSRGGKLLLLTDARIDGVQAFNEQNAFFNLMWADMGVRARDAVVVQEQVTGDNAESSQTEISSLVNSFTTVSDITHPITAGLNGELAFFDARPLEISRFLVAYESLTLLSTPNDFYGETAYEDYLATGTASYDVQQDILRGSLPLAVAISSENYTARIVMVGDREFATNGGGLQTVTHIDAAYIYPANARFLVNSISWLLEIDQAEILLSLPTSGILPTPTITPTPTLTPTLTPISTPTPSGS